MKTSSRCHLSPGRGRRRRRRSAKLARNSCTNVAPSRRRRDAAFSQEQLNIPQAEAEHVVRPDGVADDLGGEPVAVVGIRWRLCRQSRRPPGMPPYMVTVTMPRSSSCWITHNRSILASETVLPACKVRIVMNLVAVCRCRQDFHHRIGQPDRRHVKIPVSASCPVRDVAMMSQAVNRCRGVAV